MAAEDAEAPPPEEEAKKKEHEVSIVLSYMDDEHEKAAIEVRDGAGDDARSPPEGRPVPPPPTSARARNPHVPSHRSLLDAESFVRASLTAPRPARPPPPLSPRLAAQEACAAFDKHAQYKDVAQAIKKGYDLRYPSSGKATDGVYHALVGKHFGASLSHETNQYVHLKVDLHDVIVFKSKDSPFDFDYDNLNKPAVEGGA